LRYINAIHNNNNNNSTSTKLKAQSPGSHCVQKCSDIAVIVDVEGVDYVIVDLVLVAVIVVYVVFVLMFLLFLLMTFLGPLSQMPFIFPWQSFITFRIKLPTTR